MDSFTALAPGRVNLIGEHTDYNDGLALPFALTSGIRVRSRPGPRARTVVVDAIDLGERDTFSLAAPGPATGWRAYVRGVIAELQAAGHALVPAGLTIGGNLPRGAGLSSSAALEVAVALAVLAQAGGDPGDPVALARVCQRAENGWAGAHTGLLDQLASLCCAEGHALLIDFRSLALRQVPLRLGGYRLVVLDSGERHAVGDSGYNARRSECRQACALLGIGSLRDADRAAVEGLPEPLRRRARHVLGENERVRAAVAALADGDMPALGALLDASHASLRDDYEVSTGAVEGAVARLRAAGAVGARIVGGGFGGSVIGLMAPGRALPEGAAELRAGPGAHLIP